MAGSPSVKIIERDVSGYTVFDTGVGVAIMGYATKGPFNQEVLIRSLKEFEDNFGKAPTGYTKTYFAVKRLLRSTNRLYFVRVGDFATAEKAELTVDFSTDTDFFNPATNATISFTVTNEVTAAGTATLTVDGVGVNLVVAAADASNDTEAEVAALIRALTFSGYTTGGTGADVVLTRTTAGAFTPTFVFDATTTGITLSSATIVSGVAAAGITGQEIVFEALEAGSHGSSISVLKESVLQAYLGTYVHNIYVKLYGEVKEIFRNVSFDPDDANYFETLINRDPDSGGSRLITVTGSDLGGEDEFQWGVIPATKEYALELTSTNVVTVNGIYTDDATNQTYHLNALDEEVLQNIESSDFHILIAPEASMLETFKNRAIQLCEERGDAIFLVDTPEATTALTVAEVTNYHNGINAVNARDTAFNSSYGALYWPWVKEYDDVALSYQWFPSSIFLAEKLVQNAQSFGLWFAPAGDRRGRLAVSGLRYSPNKTERDTLYGETNAVNPIVDFASKGITVYGQKTLQRETTALNRINVRMTVNEIKKRIKVKMDELLFEPNSPTVWARAKSSIDAILEPIRLSGGLERYLVVIDATINTPDVVQQNIMKGIVRIVPVNTIEEIEINMFVDPAGTTFTE